MILLVVLNINLNVKWNFEMKLDLVGGFEY